MMYRSGFLFWKPVLTRDGKVAMLVIAKMIGDAGIL